MGSVDKRYSRLLSLTVAVFVALALVAGFPAGSARAAISRDSFENCLIDKLNVERANAGAVELQMAFDLVDPVRDWSQWMRFNDFEHMSSSVRSAILPSSWTTWGENIAWTSNQNIPDCSQIHEMWMTSSGHRANILKSSFRFVAIGTYVDESGWWATQLFFNATNYPGCNGTFCDDDSSIFESDIEKIAAAGITLGCNPPANDRFCPEQGVTRGAMAAFIDRSLTLPSSNAIDFLDDDDSIFEGSIQNIAAAGITLGCNPPANTKFCPNDFVTRGQVAAFLARALKF